MFDITQNKLQGQSHGLLTFLSFLFMNVLHDNHLNCTSKITVLCFLFSFFQRCRYLRSLFAKQKYQVYCFIALKLKLLPSFTILSNIFWSFIFKYFA